MASYILKVDRIHLSKEPGDIAVTLKSHLEDANYRPLLTTDGNVRYFNIRVTKSILPPSNYLSFLESAAEDAIDTAFTKTVSTEAFHNSADIVPASIDELYIGMEVIGPGITAGSMVEAILDGEIRLDNVVTRQFTGTTTSPSIIQNGDISSGNNTISNLSSTSNLALGMSIAGTGIPSGAVISVITSATSLVMNLNAAVSAIGTPLTFNPNPNSSTVTGVTPASLTVDFEGLAISGIGIAENTTIINYLSTSSFEMSNEALSSGSNTIVVSGTADFSYSPSTWTLDLSDLQRVVNIIDFSSL